MLDAFRLREFSPVAIADLADGAAGLRPERACKFDALGPVLS
jgi:hypothetical protein